MARGLTGKFEKASTVALDMAVHYLSPYLQMVDGPNIPTVSIARIKDTSSQTGDRVFGMARYFCAQALGIESPEVRQVPEVQNRTSYLLPKQETRDLSAYDSSRIQAEMDGLANRYRNHGHDDRPSDPNAGLPIQTIRDAEGKILMQGAARSVEELLAKKIKEAQTSADPTKQVINLAGAQLDKQTLGRPLNLNGFELKNIYMPHANLDGAIIHDCKIENCDMEEVSLKGAHINASVLKNVNLNGFKGDEKTKITHSSLENVHMAEADAPGIKMENIRARNLNWQAANFPGATISKMEVDNLWAPHVELGNAKIGELHVIGRDSNLEGAKMAQAEVTKSSFGTEQYGIRMVGLKAPYSKWTDVQFNHSDLSESEFTGSAFMRVDMKKVITPSGPMKMDYANITGLSAGEKAKFTANYAIYDGITMRPKENFVFSGIAPIANAAKEAKVAKSDFATIQNEEGETLEAQQARIALNVQQQAQRKRTAAMAYAPSPYGRKKNPWE